MRKFFWQRWALIFLLVSRLVIGELGHAMPVGHSVDHSVDVGAAHHHQMSATATDPAACPEHEGDNQQIPAAHPAAHVAADTSSHSSIEHAAIEQTPVVQDSAGHASGEQDCCKSGECECPCLHVPCAALDALVLNPIATTLLRTPHDAEGLVSQRPSSLFRPPA